MIDSSDACYDLLSFLGLPSSKYSVLVISPVGPRSALWTSLAQVFLPVRRNERNLSVSPSYIFLSSSYGPYSGAFYLL